MGIWSHINCHTFESEDREEEAEEFRQNVPFQVFGQFLENLKREVEKAIEDESSADNRKKAELEVTQQRLKTISSGDLQSINHASSSDIEVSQDQCFSYSFGIRWG